jgi:GTP-binding protein
VVRRPTGDGTVFADIPGLIEGAHQGLGLGHEFLRHIERTRLLLHVVDATAESPLDNFHTIQQELGAYGRDLSDRPQVLALNKVDALTPEVLADLVGQFEALVPGPVHGISAVAGTGLGPMLQQIWTLLDQMPVEAATPATPATSAAPATLE